MTKRTKEQIEKLGKLKVYTNAVIVKRKNKRTNVIRVGESKNILQLIMMIEDEEDLKKVCSSEMIEKEKVRTIEVAFSNESLIATYTAIGMYLESQGIFKELLGTDLEEIQNER